MLISNRMSVSNFKFKSLIPLHTRSYFKNSLEKTYTNRKNGQALSSLSKHAKKVVISLIIDLKHAKNVCVCTCASAYTCKLLKLDYKIFPEAFDIVMQTFMNERNMPEIYVMCAVASTMPKCPQPK